MGSFGIIRGCSSAGRAPALHAGGHRFEPVHLHFSAEGEFAHACNGFWFRFEIFHRALIDFLNYRIYDLVFAHWAIVL